MDKSIKMYTKIPSATMCNQENGKRQPKLARARQNLAKRQAAAAHPGNVYLTGYHMLPFPIPAAVAMSSREGETYSITIWCCI